MCRCINIDSFCQIKDNMRFQLFIVIMVMFTISGCELFDKNDRHYERKWVGFYGKQTKSNQRKTQPNNLTPIFNNKILKKIIYFDWTKHDVYQIDKQWIKHHAYYLRQRRFEITGYTDSTITGITHVQNVDLALERAQSVRDELVNIGIHPKKIKISSKHLCCYVANNKTAKGRALNRRAEILMIK